MDMNILFVGTVVVLVLGAWFVSTYVMKNTDQHTNIPFDTTSKSDSAYHVDTDPADDNRFI